MKSILKISQIVIDKLSRINEPTYAKLYGTHFENTTVLLAIQLDNISINQFEYAFPTEVDERAILNVNESSINEQEIIRKLSEQIVVTDNPIFISCCLNENNRISVYALVHEQLQVQPYTIISEEEIYEHSVYVRLTGNLSLTCSLDEDSYENAIENLRNSVTAGNFAFNFPKSPVYVVGNENNTTCDPLLKDICDSLNSEDNHAKKKKKESALPIVDVKIFKKLSKEMATGENEHAPICVVTKKQKDKTIIPVKIDTLSLVSQQTNFCILYEILVESIVKYLRAFHSTLLKNLKDNAKPVLPEVFHCYPKQCGHFISIWLPKDTDQKSLESNRKLLHEKLLLSTNAPLFRRENKYSFKCSINSREPIINPHKTLKNTNNGGKISLVKGSYSYYHYGQDNMNDNGWGCAYRSLQTLVSWFRMQGYTDKDVPTFEEIQKCLVEIGDKPSSFIGSRQWIGSMEVNFVLNTLLGTTCRIINVSNGADMVCEGPQLIRHFDEYGTPIMIGGGNLAHTIVGVDYNPTTGGIKFLILDPHYTGPEDLQIIQSKGWCGWKGVEFWNKTCYYNMCLPLVSNGV